MPFSVAWLLLATAVVWALYAATREADWLSWVLVAGQCVLAALAFSTAWRDSRTQEVDQSLHGQQRQPR
jgi:hypothetical protein